MVALMSSESDREHDSDILDRSDMMDNQQSAQKIPLDDNGNHINEKPLIEDAIDHQDDEAHYDGRSEADDDLIKGMLRFPQDKLFGRDEELRRLDDIFARVVSSEDTLSSNSSNVRIVLLEGYSGVGKSALIPEFVNQIKKTSSRTILFASGKYYEGQNKESSTNHLRHDVEGSPGSMPSPSMVPYSGIAHALTMLATNQSLSETISVGKSDDGSILRSTIFENNDEDQNGEFWSDSLLPDDIRLLIDIAPGLAPFLSSSFSEWDGSHHNVTYNRSRRESSLIDKDHHQQQQVGLDDSNRTLVTSNLRKRFFSASTKSSSSLSTNVESSHISMVVATFLRLILKHQNTSSATLVFFLDDMQWVDTGSLELLEYLWKDPSLPPWLFVGAVRTSNDAKTTTRLEQIHHALTSLDPDKERVHRITVRNLSPSQILRFVAETLDKIDSEDESRVQEALEEVQPLANYLYSRTLGNIFYCRQVMEALVRRNIIYYDVMRFEWQCNLSAISQQEKEFDMIELDVVQIVQDQLQHLSSPTLRNALIVASHIRHSIEPEVLLHCLQAAMSLTDIFESSQESGGNVDVTSLSKLLEIGVEQGLLLKDTVGYSDQTSVETMGIQFAHDRVQEAAYGMIPRGNDRTKLRGCLGHKLLQMVTNSIDDKNNNNKETNGTQCPPDKEWMLFTAVEHLNTLPLDQLPCDMMEFLHANYQVGTLCLSKASFEQAVKHIRIAVQCMDLNEMVNEWGEDSTSMWCHEYDFCLALHNRLLETEFALGNYVQTTKAIDAALENAQCPRDTGSAHYTRIQMLVKQNDYNYGVGAEEGAKLLTKLGQPIPVYPTKSDILKERLRYQMALGTKSISSIANLPMMEDDWVIKLLSQLVFISNLAGNTALNQFACLRALRLSLEQGVSKYLLIIMTDFSSPMRREGKYQVAYSYASVVEKLYERFPNEKGSEYATSRLILHSGMLHLKRPFVESMDAFLANYRMAMTAGNVEIALTSAMHFPLIYFASGLPLNALLEPKLILFQGKAQQLARPGFVAIFQLCRQFVCRLQGKQQIASSSQDVSSRWNVAEDEIVEGLSGNGLKMILRDSGILRLILAYVFGDEATMLIMMKRLDDYPLFDLPLTRQHLRLTFHGLAALTLGRKRGDKEMLNKGQSMMEELRKLESIGSFNARPAYLCLKAVEKHRKSAYDEAIAACSIARFGHLEATMNEECGIMLLQEAMKASTRKVEVDSIMSLAHEYIENALWLYNDWGADAKATQLRAQYYFLTPRSLPGNITGKFAISAWAKTHEQQTMMMPNRRFDVVLEDPEVHPSCRATNPTSSSELQDNRGRRSIMPSRTNHGPPTKPTRSSSPCQFQDDDEQPILTPEEEVPKEPARLSSTHDVNFQ